MTDYEKLYREEPNALGAPNKQVQRFFAKLAPCSILDVGTGQGRNAIPLATMGHRLTTIDLAPSGIEAIRAAAEMESLPIEASVGDVRTCPLDSYDFVLIDRTLHMLAEDERLPTFERIARAATRGLVINEPPAQVGPYLEHLATIDGSRLVTRRRGFFVCAYGGDQLR